MALSIETIKFLTNNISQKDFKLLSSSVKQLFSYLSTEVKDNPIYDSYEKDSIKWEKILVENEILLPDTIDDHKSFAYSIFKRISVFDYNVSQLYIYTIFHSASYQEALQQFIQYYLGHFKKALEDIIRANPELDNSTPKVVSSKTVFIIHGHDNDIKREVQLLLNRAGINSIVLHEQPDRGRTIIDKLTQETSQAGYAIALLTPDDITDGGTTRARQNVILEIGYLLGSIGKERVRMLVKGNVEIPSDLHGVLYEKHDENGAWKMRLLKEIQAVGIYVDMNSVVSQL